MYVQFAIVQLVHVLLMCVCALLCVSGQRVAISLAEDASGGALACVRRSLAPPPLQGTLLSRHSLKNVLNTLVHSMQPITINFAEYSIETIV